MKRLFVDTSAWIAIYDESDSLHEIALEWKESLLSEKAIFVLSNHMFDETATFLNVKVSNKLAVAFGDMVEESIFVEMVHCSPEFEREAWTLLKRYKDKPLSFTDCTSFVLMKEMQLKRVFTFDDDFEKVGMGFEIIPPVSLWKKKGRR